MGGAGVLSGPVAPAPVPIAAAPAAAAAPFTPWLEAPLTALPFICALNSVTCVLPVHLSASGHVPAGTNYGCRIVKTTIQECDEAHRALTALRSTDGSRRPHSPGRRGQPVPSLVARSRRTAATMNHIVLEMFLLTARASATLWPSGGSP